MISLGLVYTKLIERIARLETKMDMIYKIKSIEIHCNKNNEEK